MIFKTKSLFSLINHEELKITNIFKKLFNKGQSLV